MSNKTSTEVAIKEYEALRGEILAQWARRSSRLDTAWAAISVLLVGGAISQIPELGCLALILICSGWRDEMRWFEGMTRIGAYIKVVLEPKIQGLQWETALSMVYGPQKKANIIKRLFSTLFTTYGIFLLVTILSSILFYFQFPLNSQIRILVFWSLFAIGILYAIFVLRDAVNFGEKRRIWEERFSNIATQLNSMDIKRKAK